MPGPRPLPQSVLVVGAGLGGFHVARQLRHHGYDGEITVLGAEQHAPYDRPPLSKAYLVGALQLADLALDDARAPLEVTWVRGAVAQTLIAGTCPQGEPLHGVRTTDGRELLAHALVVASGADAIRLGPAMPGAHVLRTIEDADALRADGVCGRDVVVVGTGFVGLEAAATATALGAATVTVVGPAPVPLAERFGHAVGAAVQGLHERAGVTFRGGERVAGLHVDATGRAAGVRISSGEVVLGDLIVIGIGARPSTGWLTGAGCDERLQTAANGAIACDTLGRTSVPGVWALGDCAMWAHPTEGYRRAGHWQDALDHAAVVAADLLQTALPVTTEPYCWSDQHGVRLQVAGHLRGDERAVVRAGTVGAADLLITYERDGVETAVLGMNRPREVTRWRRARRSGRGQGAAA